MADFRFTHFTLDRGCRRVFGRISWLAIACVLLSPGPALGQAEIILNLKGNPEIVSDKPVSTKDSARAYQRLQKLRQEFYSEGYLEAGIDSILKDSLNWQVYWHLGPQYDWVNLEKGNVPEEVLSRARFSEKALRQEPFNPTEFSNLTTSVLKYYESNGYPFVQLNLEGIELEDTGISARLKLDQGPLVTLDSIIVKGEARVNRHYLQRYLELEPGEEFDQQKMESLSRRLNQISFLQKIREPELLFTDSAYTVYLYLKDREASQFDGILGLLPDPNTDDLLLTGDVRLTLLNAFNRGTRLAINWRKLQTSTQELNASFRYPYLFDTPLGVNLAIDLYRRDTLFSQTTLRAGVNYNLGGLDQFEGWFESFTGNSLNAGNQALGRQSDLRTTLYGIGWHSETLDYRFNPRSGYELDIEGAAGRKTVSRDSVNSEGENMTLETRQPQYEVEWHFRYFIPVWKRFTLMATTLGGWKQSETLYRTEAFRIGGLRDLRGFDDQSIFATTYGIGRLEFRYLLERNSNVFVFFDQAYYADRSISPAIEDSPFGFGAGANFETGVGIFSLSYALGKQFNNPIEFRSAKIHFGYTSLF